MKYSRKVDEINAEEEIREADDNIEEPVYHGENIRIMVMSSQTVQLGKLHIVTELGRKITHDQR